MAKRTYKGKLPDATKRGDVRPEVAGERFTVGNTRHDTNTQMQHRLDTLRDVFEAQAERFKIDYWAEWLLPYAKEYGKTGKVIVKPTPKIYGFIRCFDGRSNRILQILNGRVNGCVVLLLEHCRKR